jgi:ABC-type oligopeptide transport system substrate-binding subunit
LYNQSIKEASKQASKQANKQASKQASKQAIFSQCTQYKAFNCQSAPFMQKQLSNC